MKKSINTNTYTLIFQIILLGVSIGTFTGTVITVYRLIAKYAVSFSEHLYHFVRQNLWLAITIAPLLLAIAFLLRYIYKKMPTLQGGGICEAIGLVSGIFTFKWFKSLVGTFMLSIANFMLGVPLGTEGPSVQMGASLGKAATLILGKKGEAWSRYSISGGAASGFAAATGAPMTGIVFSLEEMYRRFSPIMILISITSVATCRAITELLCPIFGISVELFPAMSLPALKLKELWLPLIIGLIIGVFSLGFLYFFKLINNFINITLTKLNGAYKFFTVLALTFVLGICSFSFISTGHHLTEELFKPQGFTLALVLVLLVRSVLTLTANSTGLTGGLFLPTVAISAVASSLMANSLIYVNLVSQKYYTIIVVLGIIAGMSGTMHIPFTAIVFALEAFGCSNNLLGIIVAAGTAFTIAELFRAESINEIALKKRIKNERAGKTPISKECDVIIKENAFAVGKKVADIFWPANLFVLSVTHTKGKSFESENMQAGDVLHISYSTYDEDALRKELYTIIGE